MTNERSRADGSWRCYRVVNARNIDGRKAMKAKLQICLPENAPNSSVDKLVYSFKNVTRNVPILYIARLKGAHSTADADEDQDREY